VEISLRETKVKSVDNEKKLPTALTSFPRSSTGPTTKKTALKNLQNLLQFVYASIHTGVLLCGARLPDSDSQKPDSI